jgi:hypothetical protein
MMRRQLSDRSRLMPIVYALECLKKYGNWTDGKR